MGDWMEKRNIPKILNNATALIKINGSDKGVLLLHGFTGTPAEMKYLGERIFRSGYSIHIPRYPGHGTSLEEMVLTRSRDWYISAREALIELMNYCQEVYLVGMSMGGILSILLAREFSIKRIALLSVPASIKEKSIYITPVVGIFKKILWRMNPTKGVSCEEARSYHVCYNMGIPIRQSWQLLRLIKKAMKNLPHVHSDALLIQSQNDSIIPKNSIDFIYERLGSAIKERVVLERSDHAITIDFEKDIVADRIIEFFNR
jgi:carboxylesterase